jgi:transitional endoplasmic reticulum ATPase
MTKAQAIDFRDDHAVARTLKVGEALAADHNRGIVRLDLDFMSEIGCAIGDVLSLEGKATAYARAMPLPVSLRGTGSILVDQTLRSNAGLTIGEAATVLKTDLPVAKRVEFAREDKADGVKLTMRQLCDEFEHKPLVAGNVFSIGLANGKSLTLKVTATEPAGPVIGGQATAFLLMANGAPSSETSLSYGDLGGLSREVARVREMIELPIKRPDFFEHLGIQPPRGVLLSGPPGTGKTLLARAVARECQASFFQINGPEIVGKHYGESEKHLRDIFRKAENEQPAVIFIDEIDAIAPKRDSLNGDRQVERRIVGQLLTLLDGLTNRGQVIVMAATNLPNSLDPALRRPGRFDREIVFGVPDKAARRDILNIHTSAMPLAQDVDLDHIASVSHGYVGADLAALAREAGMSALRRATQAEVSPEHLNVSNLLVQQVDFLQAHQEIVPSAIREVYTDIPESSWSDIGGHDDIKQALIEAVVWPLKHGDLYESAGVRPSKGILLAGPPGTGKTLLALTLASESGVSFISVRGPQLLSQFVGESERAIRDVFQKARLAAPCILFFDEIDALTPRRGGEAGAVMDRIVAQFLTEIDGIDDLRGVFVLAATNRQDQVDPAVLRPGRFDLTLDVGLPDAATRQTILEIHAAKSKLDKTVDLGALATRLDGLSGAELEAVVRQAAMAAIRRSVSTGINDNYALPVLTSTDFTEAAMAVSAANANRRSTTR